MFRLLDGAAKLTRCAQGGAEPNFRSDAQVSARRLMVPDCYKGRGGNSGSTPVPVGDDVIEMLLPAIVERSSDAPLFERLIHEQEPRGIVWSLNAVRGKEANLHVLGRPFGSTPLCRR